MTNNNTHCDDRCWILNNTDTWRVHVYTLAQADAHPHKNAFRHYLLGDDEKTETGIQERKPIESTASNTKSKFYVNTQTEQYQFILSSTKRIHLLY